MNIYDFQRKWRKPLYIIGALFCMSCLFMELLIYFTPALRSQVSSTDEKFRLIYIYLPTILNVLALFVALVFLRSKSISQKGKNNTICILLLVICMVIQNLHGMYAAVLCLPCLAIFVSTIFASDKTTYIMTIVAMASTFSSYLVNKAILGFENILLSNYIIACAIIVVTYFCSHLLIRYIFTQMVSVSEGVKNERALLNKMRLDPLTGLYNRGGMDSILDELIKNYTPEHPLYLLMIDIDNFKRVNDTYGHQNGDVVLRTLAQHILDMGRKDIIPCRYGGEEIVVIYKNMSFDDALGRSNNLLDRIRLTKFDFAGENKITFSGGFCQYSPQITKDEWIKIADLRLYYAKHSGKNRIISIPVEESEQIL